MAGVLGTAVVMLGWHNLWMASHGAALAKNARSMGKRRPRRAGASARCC